MTTYYDITLSADIPQGSDILNKACVIIFTYPGGSFSNPYSATVFAWLTANTVRVTSATLNIDSAWAGANGGTLTISTAPPLSRGITGFAKVP